MAQFYTVDKCFPNSDKQTKERIINDGQYGPTVKWLFKVKEANTSKWMSVNRKPDNDLKPGESLYGDIEQWPDGGEKFVRKQPPMGSQAPQNASTSKQQSAGSGDVNKKLDYIISLLENHPSFKSGNTSTQGNNKNSSQDDDPIDLSDLDI